MLGIEEIWPEWSEIVNSEHDMWPYPTKVKHDRASTYTS